MIENSTNTIYDVIIVGAGPAGATCALALKDAGLKVALIDKSSFPRDKVCGDAIPGRALKVLKSISPSFTEAFKQFPLKFETGSTAVVYKGKRVQFDWRGDAYTCPRLDFDNFLLSLVQNHTDTELLTNAKSEKITRSPDGYNLLLNNGRYLNTKMLIGADGANSIVAKELAGKQLDRAHFAGSVRAYYANVAGTNDRVLDIYFEKNLLPSYLWVFPVSGQRVNVGIGMLSSEIAKRKLNLKTTFHDFINQVPELKARFRDAVQVSPLEGYGLPLGSKIETISGDRFMLAGDAASLVDPITGEGIGNAMLSGKLAAEQIIQCFANNDFSSSFMSNYDKSLLNAIGQELKIRYRTQQLFSRMPFMFDLAFLLSKNKRIKELIQRSL